LIRILNVNDNLTVTKIKIFSKKIRSFGANIADVTIGIKRMKANRFITMIYSTVFNPNLKMLGTTHVSKTQQHTALTLKNGGNGGGTNDGGYIWVG
jgi:hypothetical protein